VKKIFVTALLIALAVCSGCAHQQDFNKQEKFVSAAPKSILIVPVVNNSVEVTAADYMLSTVTVPFAERGYYVFPVNLVKRVLEDDGLADSSLVHKAPASKLAALFGADAVLYITIDRWDAKYAVLTTIVTVGVTYQIRDGKTDELLWENKETMKYDPNKSGGSSGNPIADLIVMAVKAVVTKATPQYVPLARQANAMAVMTYPGSGLPLGPYATDKELTLAK
jgi:hypothetical protein